LHKQYRAQKYSPDHYTGPTSSAVTAQLWPPQNCYISGPNGLQNKIS